jgi:HSP20 family protein
MTKLAVQRPSRTFLPELSDLSQLFSGFPAFPNYPTMAGLRPFSDSHLIRIEDEVLEGRYEVRAELPGVDPAEIGVTVRDGQLTVRATRAEKTASNGRSEFRYGAFTRTVPLPVGADEEAITASYGRGVLTVAVPVHGDEHTGRQVEVQAVDRDVTVASHSE